MSWRANYDRSESDHAAYRSDPQRRKRVRDMYMPNEDIYWERVREQKQSEYEPKEDTHFLYLDNDDKADIEKDYEVDDIKELSRYDLEEVVKQYESDPIDGDIDTDSIYWDSEQKCIEYTVVIAA